MQLNVAYTRQSVQQNQYALGSTHYRKCTTQLDTTLNKVCTNVVLYTTQRAQQNYFALEGLHYKINMHEKKCTRWPTLQNKYA